MRARWGTVPWGFGATSWRRRQAACWIACIALLLAHGTGVRAQAEEPWLLDLEASAGLPITKPQQDWFFLGGSFALTVSKPLVPWFSLAARVRSAGLLDGASPKIVGAEDPSFGTLNTGSLGFIARLPTPGVRRSTGLWIDGAFGGGLTGSLIRPAFEAGLGYGFYAGARGAVGPVLRYIQVLQSDDALSGSDARIALVGLRVSLFDVRELSPRRRPAPPPPPPDEDNDGILDASDRCIDVPEDRDEFEDEDGCPELDNDKDGIKDPSDGCPNMAEDTDGQLDEDGCPEDDNDGDGILDGEDKCPLEPETLNGENDEDGCPDEGLIVMTDDRIVLEERVLFDSERARVKSTATPVLSAIVRLWKQHPEWMRVRIEGHADLRGDPAVNQELSQRRAANVRATLIKLGIKPDVIIAEGFGATRPLTTGTSDDDHRKNRRVEFAVLARFGDSQSSAPTPDPEPASAAPETVEPTAAPEAVPEPVEPATEQTP